MGKQRILLNVRGSYGEDSGGNTLELFTEGLLTEESGTYTIEYDESAMSGIENTKTRLVVDGDNIHLQHKGDFESELVFSLRRLYAAAYDTPYGLLELSVLPTQVASKVSPEKGHINLEYVINIGEQSAFNKLYIDYRLKN